MRARAMPAPMPPLSPLTWNACVAAIAADWASRCRLEHHTDIIGTYGENIFASTELSTSPTSVVEDWASEAGDYDYASSSCANRCGHYTQLVWRSTTSVGCASAVCQTNNPLNVDRPWLFWVCDYAPAGNSNGERPY